MSAECSKCGADITYPPGTWPVGRCEPCDLRALVERYEDAIRDALDFLTGWSRPMPDAERLVCASKELTHALAARTAV